MSAPNGQFLKLANGHGLDDIGRHEHENYHGHVAGVSGTAPDISFTLQRGIFSVRVQTDANTTIFNESGAQTPVLVNGARVKARGVYDNVRDVLRATSVKIENGVDDNDEAEAKGPTSAVSEGGGHVRPKRARGPAVRARHADDHRPHDGRDPVLLPSWRDADAGGVLRPARHGHRG